jgi:cell wall-associated NlpC family hydrolase
MTIARIPMTLILFAAALACGLGGSPGPAGDEATAAVVTRAVENMHRRSSADTDVVSQAILGTNVKLLKKERNAAGEDWYEVETPDTYTGWIAAPALRVLGPGEAPYASSGRVFVVGALLANTYREPDVTKHKPLKVAPLSSLLEVTGEKGERWLEVRLPCGAGAWIQRGDGDLCEAPWAWPRRPVEDMVALSKRFLGLPYTWGGTSPLGLDCSGFVQLVYRMSGIPILRDADIQMEKSGLAEVAKGEERAGDLVFFGSRGIGHVGMMIDGELFINATTHETPTVRIDRLKDEYWQKIYRGARRPSDRSER